nr:hypothetical protein [Tanacetum cinerariifolium]
MFMDFMVVTEAVGHLVTDIMEKVKGLPCVHASAFISFPRDSWEKYCDPYFTIERFKDAYAFGVAMMLGKDQWYVIGKSFIELNSDENFMAMLNMYEQEKEITIYVSTDKNLGTHNTQQSNDDDGDVNEILNYDYSNAKKSPTMEVSSKFPNVVAFRRALNHHAVINEYDYFIEKSDLERFTARRTQQECP